MRSGRRGGEPCADCKGRTDRFPAGPTSAGQEARDLVSPLKGITNMGGRPMRSLLSALCVASLCGALLTGCLTDEALQANNRTADPAGDGPAPSFAQFPDMPVPEGAVMDIDRSLILGGTEAWIGRLVYTVAIRPTRVFDFYVAEMGSFGWREVTMVRAGTTVMTYQRDSRVATIQIDTTATTGSQVLVTVSPEGRPLPATAGGQIVQ